MIVYINTKDKNVVAVSLKKDGKVIQIVSEENEYGSQVLLPLIEQLLKQEKLDYKDLQGIEVETGLGSFTGLRVGASVAQALGFVLNIPVNGTVGKNIELRYT